MKDIFRKYRSPYFVETGSLDGKGIDAALSAGFNNVISIELSNRHYRFCRDKYKNRSEVTIVHGDSGLILGDVISEINDKITFWLDSHYSGGGTASGCEPVPLMRELQWIKDHHVKEHTILIDDMRLLRDKANEWSYLTFDENDLISFLKTINGNYKISYEDTSRSEKDVLVCRL